MQTHTVCINGAAQCLQYNLSNFFKEDLRNNHNREQSKMYTDSRYIRKQQKNKEMTEQTSNKERHWLQMSTFKTATTISLRCSPSGSSLIFKLTLTGSTGLLYSQSHTHTLFSTSLLPSLCSPQRSILLLQLKSLLEVSYSVGHTMQICDCRRAFGPSNYPKPTKNATP